MRKIWPFSFNFLWFASVAFVVPFVVLFYQQLGFTGAEIGVLTGITPLITFFSAPFWTSLADAKRKHRLIMSMSIFIGVLSLIAYPLLTTFVGLLLVVIVLNIFLAPVQSFADSATMHMLGERKEMYGRIRVGGTLGFGLVAALAGVLVNNYGLKIAFWGSAGVMFLALLISQEFVFEPAKEEDQIGGSLRPLLRNPHWLLFLTLAFAGGLGMASTNNYLLPFMKELGANEAIMGFTLTFGTVGEVPILFFGNRLIRRFGSYRLLLLSMFLTSLRLLLFGVSHTPTAVVLVQLLNGLNFPAMWIAGVAYADERAPRGLSASAQGQFGAMVLGIGNAVGGFMGGLLLERMAGHGLFLVFGGIVLFTVVMVSLLNKRLAVEEAISIGEATIQ